LAFSSQFNTHRIDCLYFGLTKVQGALTEEERSVRLTSSLI
jgi:hypothetical protein